MSIRGGVVKKPEDDKPWGDLMSFWKSSEPPLSEEAAAQAARMKRSISDRQNKGKVELDKLTRDDDDDDAAPPPLPAGANRTSMHGLAEEDREKIQQAFLEAEENFKGDFSDDSVEDDGDDAGMSLTKGKDKKKRGIFARNKAKTTELDPNAPSTIKVTQDSDDGHLTLAAKDKVAKRRSKARAKQGTGGDFAYDSDHSGSSDAGDAAEDDAAGMSFVSASKAKAAPAPAPASPLPAPPASVKPLPQPNKRPPSNRNLQAGLRPKPSPNPNPNRKIAASIAPLLPAGALCCDCGTPDPLWGVVKYGVFVCASCVMVHRQMLPMAEQKLIRSVDDPQWDAAPADVAKMKAVWGNGGGGGFNAVWEASVPPEFVKPRPGGMDNVVRDKWVRAKYAGKFKVGGVKSGSRPPPPQQAAPAPPPAVKMEKEEMKAMMLELLREDKEFRTEVRKALNLRKVQRKKRS